MADDIPIHDVLIIGGGTCGLAMASRLCEPSPSALFTDEEHQRYHWIRKHGHRMATVKRKSGKLVPACTDDKCCAADGKPHRQVKYNTLVLDATADSWMGRWNELFTRFGIVHLRSPMFWHVDPSERDALLAYAYELGREKDLYELEGCVGKEISKHLRKARSKKSAKGLHADVEINERDKRDYYNPPSDMFMDHCQSVATRYGLNQQGLVRKERVQDVKFEVFPAVSREEKLFEVKTDAGETHYARAVVLAVGPANLPHIPKGIEGLMPTENLSEVPPRMAHVMQMKSKFPDPSIKAMIKAGKPSTILIVGAGLTSAQLSDLAVQAGVTKVWHLVRRRNISKKYFDVGLEWMGKYRNVQQAYFHGAEDDDERLEMIQTAREGGSMSPKFLKLLMDHVASGKVDLRCGTLVKKAEFDESTMTWGITTDPPIPEMPRFDYVYFSTGIEADVRTLPYMQNLLREHPIETRGGMPCLTDDLAWADDVPFFVTGRLAGLRLGPAAPNLGGARAGAERISWAIDEFLEKRMAELGEELGGPRIYDQEEEDEYEFVTGRGNMFKKLYIGEDAEW